jgi:hypothetical protein
MKIIYLPVSQVLFDAESLPSVRDNSAILEYEIVAGTRELKLTQREFNLLREAFKLIEIM